MEDEEEAEEDAELNLDKVEEDMAAEYSEEEEDEILHIDEYSAIMAANQAAGVASQQLANTSAGGGSAAPGASVLLKPGEILQSTTDAEAWNLEVERVAPQLKVRPAVMRIASQLIQLN